MATGSDFEARFRVPERGVRLADRDPTDSACLTEEQARQRQASELHRLCQLQDRLFAERQRALLVVLQGLDASGKDSTVKHVMGRINPQGVTVTPFKEPTSLELAHDFLWRAQLALPARGHIGVFNRSHYEEVAVVRVHPELLANEAVDPRRAQDPRFWTQRFEDITAWERHLTRAGTRTVKFFLHISKSEQLRRLLARADQPEKQWKFSPSDLREHYQWDAYQHVYEVALSATSSADEPWYVIPADHRWFSRTAVAAIIVEHLADMDPHYPMAPPGQLAEMRKAIAELASADSGARARPRA